jgi:hypothetical protein
LERLANTGGVAVIARSNIAVATPTSQPLLQKNW